MDKSVGRDKRSKDKHHKKRPPVKSTTTATTTGGSKSHQQKEVPQQTPSAPLIVYDDPYSRRPIESNWHSGKNLSSPEGSSDSEDDQLRAADFEKLLQMPPSASGHFFLSTEKHWTSEGEDKSGGAGSGQQQQQYGKYFQIDTKQLNASLATIPLHERNSYPGELFSKAEIDSMKLKAYHETKKYEESCKKMSSGSKPTPPVKCLIGADAVPPVKPAVQQPPQIPSRPVPCLIGPMALPPELRNNPNVTTGSYASASVPAVTERLREVGIGESGHDVATGGTSESVPIGNNEKENEEGAKAVDGEKNDQPAASGTGVQRAGQETKEDIQQWLDDILDM